MLVLAFVYPSSVSSTNQLQYLLCLFFSILHIIVVFSIILKLSFQKFIFIVSFTNQTVTFGLINTYKAYYYYSVPCVSAKFKVLIMQQFITFNDTTTIKVKVLIYDFLLPAFITHTQSWYFSHNTVQVYCFVYSLCSVHTF